MMETAVVLAERQKIEQEFNEYMQEDGKKIIWSIIHRCCGELDYEDAYQELSIALWKAMAAYNPDKKVKKSTYIYQAVYNQIKMMLRDQSTAKRLINRQTSPAEECPHLHDPGFNMEEDVIEDMILKSRANALRWAIRNGGLTDEEQKVIQLTLKDLYQKEIGVKLGCSQSHVSVVKVSALKKIKAALQDAQWDGSGIWTPDSQ